MPNPFEDAERQVARGERLKIALQGAARPMPRPARRRLDDDQLAARVIDLGREVERITGSEIVLPQSAFEAIDQAVTERFPDEPYGKIAERFRATQIDIAKGALTLDGQIEGVPATREVFLNMHPEIAADLADAARFQTESQEQGRDLYTLAKLTNPGLDEAAAEAVVRDAVASGRDVRRALLEFSSETSPDAHEALVDFHVATASPEHRYEGDGRQEFADATDAQIDEVLDRPLAPKSQPRQFTPDEIDNMTDAEVEAATDALVSDSE